MAHLPWRVPDRLSITLLDDSYYKYMSYGSIDLGGFEGLERAGTGS